MVCPTLRQVMGYRLELEDAAASRAYGLQPNDIIIEIDGRWLLDVPDQHAELQRYAARPTIQLDLLVRSLSRVSRTLPVSIYGVGRWLQRTTFYCTSSKDHQLMSFLQPTKK